MRFALLLFLAVLFGSAFAESYSSAHEQVKQLFLSDEEPTTKDALWTAKDIFESPRVSRRLFGLSHAAMAV